MKFFAAVKLATFADELLKAAGLDLTALAAAGDKDAVKNAITAKSGAAEAEATLADAVKENGELTEKLTAAEKFKGDADKFTTLAAAVKSTGLNPDEPSKLKEQHEAAVAKSARLMVAKAGHPGIFDDINPEGVKTPKKPAAESNLTGRDRMAASFSREIAALNRRENDHRN